MEFIATTTVGSQKDLNGSMTPRSNTRAYHIYFGISSCSTKKRKKKL